MRARPVTEVMLIVLQRSARIADAIPGELTIDGTHAAWTLERVRVAIPAGQYVVKVSFSPKFQREMPELQDVPGRSDILIHWGNYPEDSDGCLLVGKEMDRLTGDVFSSKQAFQELFPIIDSAVQTEGCSIDVRDPLTDWEDVQDAVTGEN